MKVSLNWLTDYVDISIPAAELAGLLTGIGLAVEEVIETETDIVLDLDVTSNRPDCLGHLGVAREIAAVTGAEFRPPKIEDPPVSGKVGELASVEVLAADLCPRYTARVIRGVKIGPSPQWMVERLEAVGMRSVGNVVDVTNYVLMEYSQPLHSFDYDKLAGGKIIVRRGRAGETMVSIDQTTCLLDERMLVIADASRPVAVAGVMGGLGTEVSESTVNVLIESAQFDPLATRYTSRKLQLMSESNFRFERGVDPVRLDEASRRACQLIVALAGGRVAEGVIDLCRQPWQPRTVTLRPERCDKLLGVATSPERQREILDSLALDAKMRGDEIVCTIPSHRQDLRRETDLIEEVARTVGYDRIPVRADVCHPVRAESLARRTLRTVAGTMTASGFDEAVSSTFTDARQAASFGWPAPVAVDARVRKTNNILRPTIVPSLLAACKTNQDAGNGQVSLFEIATVFQPVAGRDRPDEHLELAAVTTRSLRDLRGAIEAVVERVDRSATVAVAQRDAPAMASGQAGDLLVDGQVVGLIGTVAPELLDGYGLNADRPIAAAAVRFDALQRLAGRQRIYEPLAKFPPVRRDLSLIVDDRVRWNDIVSAIAAVDQPMRVSVDYVTTYRGKQISPGRKSVTVELTYRSNDATLRSEQVDRQVAEVVSNLKEKFSAELRA